MHSGAALLAVAYRGQNAIEIWNLADGKQVEAVLIRSKAFLIAISPQGDRLAVIHGERAEDAGRYDPLDYRLEIRARRGGEVLSKIALGRREPRFIHYMPDGQHLYFGYSDNVRILDLSDQKAIHSLDDVREIRTLRLAPDGQYMAISDGHRVRVWDMTTGRAVNQLPVTGYIHAIGFTPDGRYLATASGNDDLTLWLWRPDELIGQACGHLTRNLTLNEWRDFLPNTPYRPTCANLPSDEDEQ